jgi:hypothetical protein
MSRLVVPIQPIPNQTLQVDLNGQASIISIYQSAYALFMDLHVGNELVVCGVICENLNRIVRSLYLGFSGDLVFVDTQGSPQQDPVYTGLGSRFVLVYIPPELLPAEEG